jgi:ribosomal protein S12 methylthiotransferase
VRSTSSWGFPGETDEQFQHLLDFVDDIGLDHAGGFVYSPEEGTVGATLRPRVRKRVAIQRLNRLTEVLALRAQDVHGRLLGMTFPVMIDTLGPFEDDEAETGIAAIGRTEGQAPDVDGVTYIEGVLPDGVRVGDVVDVTMTDAVGHDMIGRCDD